MVLLAAVAVGIWDSYCCGLKPGKVGRTCRTDDRSRRWHLVSGDRLRRFRLARLGNLVAQLKQAEQDLVALRLQLLDGARSDLSVDAVDELLLHFRSQHRRAEGLPPGRHRAGELLEEVLDAAWTAAEMVEHQAAHNAPAQAGAPGESRVDIGGAHHALSDKVINFATEGRLQAVGDMPGHFLVDAHRPLPDRAVKFIRALDCRFRGLGPTDDLDQRD